jgi:hypothetical protein
MKHFTKYLIAIMLVVAALGSSAISYAAPSERGPGRGLGGEVTAVGDSSLTLVNRNDEAVVVNVSDETEIHFVATQSDGSLSDIEVGAHVSVRGRRTQDGSVDARSITVQPDGDKVRGRVTAVDGTTITLENREGSATITTDGSTEFRLGQEAGSLSDVSEDSSVVAFAETQADGSLAATLVIIHERAARDEAPDGARGRGQGRRGGGR